MSQAFTGSRISRTDEEAHQARVFDRWARSGGFLQSTIDPRDRKGLKCAYIDRWSRHYIRRYVLDGPVESVLEIGCGTGRNLFPLASRLRMGFGVDIAPGQIRLAEETRRKLGLDNVRFFLDPEELFAARPEIDVAFTMWVLAGFDADENLIQMLRAYREGLPRTRTFVFFEQTAPESLRVEDEGAFLKRVRTEARYREIFAAAGLSVIRYDLLPEKGFGPLYRVVYRSRLYRYLPRWLNLNSLLFAVDRRIVRRRAREPFTDAVFVCRTAG